MLKLKYVRWVVYVANKEVFMLNAANELRSSSNSISSKFSDEFEKYLKKQTLKTTFNGSDIETFSWYKKMLGIGC